jgi:hypothetical protein
LLAVKRKVLNLVVGSVRHLPPGEQPRISCAVPPLPECPSEPRGGGAPPPTVGCLP